MRVFHHIILFFKCMHLINVRIMVCAECWHTPLLIGVGEAQPQVLVESTVNKKRKRYGKEEKLKIVKYYHIRVLGTFHACARYVCSCCPTLNA